MKETEKNLPLNSSVEVIWANLLLKPGAVSKLPGPPVPFLQSCFLDFWHAASQNHRMVEVKRDLWMSSGPKPMLREDHLKRVAQDQMAFEYLRRWRLYNLPGQPVPVLGHPYSENVVAQAQGLSQYDP